MTAREYLESRGLVALEGNEYVVRWERRDSERVRVVTAPLGYVLSVFGPTIEAALTAGRSVYDALMSAKFNVETQVEGPDGQLTTITVQRTALELGWAGHFGAWRAAGLID